MLARETETRNFGAASMVDVKDGTGVPVMFMQASIAADGKINFSNTINDAAKYLENKEEVDADWNAFQQKVINIISR